jgi:hypothetical protein
VGKWLAVAIGRGGLTVEPLQMNQDKARGGIIGGALALAHVVLSVLKLVSRPFKGVPSSAAVKSTMVKKPGSNWCKRFPFVG